MSAEMIDLNILYNGVTLYNAPSRSMLLLQAMNNVALPYVQQQVENGAQVNNYFYEAQFSLADVARESASVQDGLQIGNNSLVVQFKPDVSKMLALGTPQATFGANAVLRVIYFYNCGAVFSQGGARTDFIF